MAAEALFLLASKFEIDGFPMQAMHCLQGMIGIKLLPELKVRARCRLGRMLLTHTHNLKQAKAHLHQAVGDGSSRILRCHMHTVMACCMLKIA